MEENKKLKNLYDSLGALIEVYLRMLCCEISISLEMKNSLVQSITELCKAISDYVV